MSIVDPRVAVSGEYQPLAFYLQKINESKLSAEDKLAAINTLVATGNTEITNLQSAINTAAAAGAGANGWTALVVQDANGKNQQQINNLLTINRIVYIEDYVSDRTGVTDVTTQIQSLLDTHDGDIYAKSGSVFKTSNTLFNRKSNRTIDFHNAKIINKADSRYAIVTISPSFVGTTDAELLVFMRNRHYGEEITNSHVKKLQYEMSANTSGGNNLGCGIVYGYKCKMSGLLPIMTNGNGFEIRNSLQCGLYNSVINGHKNYTCFVFMSQRCEIIGNTFKNGTRGVCTKMNRDGDRNCNHTIAFNTFEDASNNGRAIIGGEFRETVLTDEIYVAGHEWVYGNKVHDNTFISTTSPQTLALASFSDSWSIYNNTFKCNNVAGAAIVIGGEGNVTASEKLGGNHEIYGNKFYDANAFGTNLIASRLSTKIYNNYFYNCKAQYFYYALEDQAGNALDYAEIYDNHFVGTGNAVYCNTNAAHGFVATNKVKNFAFRGNVGQITALKNGAYTSCTLVSSSADNTDLSGGDLSIIAGTDVVSITGAIITQGNVKNLTNRKVTIGAPTTAIGLQLQAGVVVQTKHEGNTYVLSGTATTARAVVNYVDFTDGVNTYDGAWTTKIFNNFNKPVTRTNVDRQATAMPTVGDYAKGDYVRNTNPSVASGSVIMGWLRLTTGSSHTQGTDWIAVKGTV